MVPGKIDIIVSLSEEEHIGQCIRSSLAQTYRSINVTVIVNDDGSADCSLRRRIVQELVDEYVAEDNRSRNQDGYAARGKTPLQVIEVNHKGFAEARNTAIRSTDGEFIVLLNSNDYIDQRYLEFTIKKMNPKVGKVGIVATDTKLEGLLHNRISQKSVTLEDVMRQNDIPSCSLIRREAFNQTKGYETIFEDLGYPGSEFEDWCLALDILKRGWTIASVNEPLFHRRIVPTQAPPIENAGLLRVMHLLHQDLWPRG
jgi:glycosyltransferase involved in cell wall biosynthesis